MLAFIENFWPIIVIIVMAVLQKLFSGEDEEQETTTPKRREDWPEMSEEDRRRAEEIRRRAIAEQMGRQHRESHGDDRQQAQQALERERARAHAERERARREQARQESSPIPDGEAPDDYYATLRGGRTTQSQPEPSGTQNPLDRMRALIAEQERKIAETQRTKEEARAKLLQSAAAAKAKSRRKTRGKRRTSAQPSGEGLEELTLAEKIRMDLEDQESLKKAFLLTELLGPPVALRKDEKPGQRW